jgi:N-acetylglucosamine malate deacetylase 1
LPDIDCLAFSPHPDDAELFCGGLLLKLKKLGSTTAIVDLTLGELSTNGSPEIRAAETAKASEILQLDVRENLKISDGNIEDSSENHNKIISVIRNYRPAICLIPYWRDRHPDHEAAAWLLKRAIFMAGLNKINTNQDAYRPATILNYMLHYNFEPSFVVDISHEIDRKIEAIMAYKSQFVLSKNNTHDTYINRPDFLDSLKIRSAFYGQQAGVSYAEAFYYDGSIKIDNILTHFA